MLQVLENIWDEKKSAAMWAERSRSSKTAARKFWLEKIAKLHANCAGCKSSYVSSSICFFYLDLNVF